MAVLDPKIAVLDETDSGLDIDALKIVAHGINALKKSKTAIIKSELLKKFVGN